MGKFKYLVDNPALIEIFKDKYHIPHEVSLRYCSPEGLAFDREVGEVIIPMIAFIEGGMILPIGSDDAEILTSEVHDPYARTTGA